MSTALQFTSIFDPANPPQKLSNGGMGMNTTPVAASKALEARGIKTQAVKDLETPPPVSVADKSENLEPRFMPTSDNIMRKFEDLSPPDKKSMEEFFNRLQMQEYMERMRPNEDLRDDMLKENLQQILQKTKFGVDYSAEVAAAAKDLTKKTWGKALSTEAETLKEDVSKNKAIKNALFKKFEKPVHVISGFESDSFNEIDTDKLNVGFNIVSYAGGKIIIEKLTDQSVSVRTDLPVS